MSQCFGLPVEQPIRLEAEGEHDQVDGIVDQSLMIVLKKTIAPAKLAPEVRKASAGLRPDMTVRAPAPMATSTASNRITADRAVSSFEVLFVVDWLFVLLTMPSRCDRILICMSWGATYPTVESVEKMFTQGRGVPAWR
jgi:hypothetical protein